MMKKWGLRWSTTFLIAITLVFVLVLGALAEPQQLDLQELQRAIRQQGADWTAEENEISRLSSQEFKSLLGLKLEWDLIVKAPGEAVITESSYKAQLPAKFDWRDYKGSSYVTPIKRQRCGDCWAHSAAATLESRLMIDGEGPLDLSEQLMVSSCYPNGSCGGGPIVDATRFLVDVGLPEESCYPYLGSNSSCSDACGGWRNITYQSTSWTRVESTVEALKTAVYARGPVNTAYMVYADFSKYRGGVYEYTSGGLQGGHGVVIVGYDDNQQCFIVKNSWGKNWGENGYFRIAYSQIHNKVKFGQPAVVLGDEIDHSDQEDDHDPPIPDPLTWKSAPSAVGSKTITMTAEQASDPSGAEYFFECTSGDGHDSGWQDSPAYTDTGLTPESSYAYRVKARDKSPQQNETGWSSEAEATTKDATAAIEMISPFQSGLSHPAPQGVNRLLAVTIHAEDDNTNVRATSVTYGGQPMTLAVEQHAESGYRAYAAVFVLSEEDIANAANGDIKVIWNELPSRTPGYTSAFFSNVNPLEPISASDGTDAHSNSISTAALTTKPGDMALVAATCGNTGSYDVAAPFTEVQEIDLPSSDAIVGYWSADGRAAAPEVTHSNANRQAAVALVLSLAGDDTPMPPSPTPSPGDSAVEIIGDWQSGLRHTVTDGSDRLLVLTVHAEDDDTNVIAKSVFYGGQEMQKVTEIHVGTDYRAYVAVFVLNEEGIAAARSSDFYVDWSQTPHRPPGYTSVCLANVNQAQPTDGFEHAIGNSATVQTVVMDNQVGNLFIIAGTCGNRGSYTLGSGSTKAVEISMVSSDGVAGHLKCTGEPVAISAKHTRVNRQALTSVEVNSK